MNDTLKPTAAPSGGRTFGDRVSVRGDGDDVEIVLHLPGIGVIGGNWCLTYDELRVLMRQMRRARDYLSGARRRKP